MRNFLKMLSVSAVVVLSLGASSCESQQAGSQGNATPVPRSGTWHEQQQGVVSLPFGEAREPSSQVACGRESILVEGTPGKATITDDVVYTDGREVGRARLATTTTVHPVNRRVGVGNPCAPVVPDSGPRTPIGGDLDCADVSYEEAQYWVSQGDPHGFDGDGDGEGCEGNR